MLVVIATFSPSLAINMEGRVEHASLVTGALVLADQGMWALTSLILGMTIVAPVLKLGGLVYVLAGVRMRRVPRHLVPVLRSLGVLRPWSMIEVYLLGMFVAYVKLAGLATVTLGAAVYALAALMVVMATIDAVADADDLWEAVERRMPTAPDATPANAPRARCEGCGKLAPFAGEGSRCPRCGARLARRKRASLARTWALMLAAAILYVPANAYPIMTVISFGSGEPDTIVSGVQHLLESGMWPLALLVFFASITVPVLKICGLTLLLVTTQLGARWRLHDRTIMFRVIEGIGRWSMIDVFMLSILVGLVRLGRIASVTPGVGAISFAAVVVLTMLAALSFDPRVMWDEAGENR